MKNICGKWKKKGKCFFEANNLVCKKIQEKWNKQNRKDYLDLYYQHHIK